MFGPGYRHEHGRADNGQLKPCHHNPGASNCAQAHNDDLTNIESYGQSLQQNERDQYDGHVVEIDPELRRLAPLNLSAGGRI